MTPNTWSKLSEGTGLEISSDLGNRKAWVIKATILSLTAAALQACSPAQAADAPQDTAQVIKVADNKATDVNIDTVISPGETGGSVETIRSLDSILEAGKTEWMENASEKYGDRTERAWDSLVRTISKEGLTELSPGTINKIETYTPNMLAAFVNVDKSLHPKLYSMWSLEEARVFAHQVWAEVNN